MASELSRFLDAQQGTYGTALAELESGRKRGHWMWFIFPQLRGLGHSEMSRHYGIVDLAEAQAYVRHPVLGSRLTECANVVLSLGDVSLHDIFGSPDDLKFVSSMTLFALVPEAPDVYQRALSRFNAGNSDPATLRLLART